MVRGIHGRPHWRWTRRAPSARTRRSFHLGRKSRESRKGNESLGATVPELFWACPELLLVGSQVFQERPAQLVLWICARRQETPFVCLLLRLGQKFPDIRI